MRGLPAPILAAALAAATISGPAAQTIDVDGGGVQPRPDDPLTPAQRDAIAETERQRRDAARRSGESVLPIFVGEGPPRAAPPAPAGPPAAVRPDPPPPAAPPPAARPPGPPAPSASAPATPGGIVTDALNEVPEPLTPPRQQSLETLEGRSAPSSNPFDPIIKHLTTPPAMVRIEYQQRPQAPAAAKPQAQAQRAAAPAPAIPAVRPGQALYARALYEVNSAHPGPVVVEILEPPLAGAVATGRAEAQGDRMAVRLSTLSWRGRSAPVEAWAVDLGTAGFGVETEVDRHLFSRIILPAAIRFAEGFLTRAGQPEQTVSNADEVTYTSSRPSDRQAAYAGGAAATRTLGDVLLQDAPARATLRIPRDTELAVLFLAAPSAPAPAAPAAGAPAAPPEGPAPR